MYSFTVGDRVWAQAEWGDEPRESRMGTVKRITKHGKAITSFASWSELMFRSDGFSEGGVFRIIKHIPKSELDLTGRI